MFQSETYELMDCMAYDYATTNNHNDIYNQMGYLTRGVDGTVFSANAWSNMYFKNGSSTDFNNTGLVVELDVIEVTGSSANIIIYDGANNANYLNQGHYKFIFQNGTITEYKDGNQVTPTDNAYDGSVATVKLGFRVTSNDCTFKYKDLMVYPI